MDLKADNLRVWLDDASDSELDALGFGVVGIDDAGKVCRYSMTESRMSGLPRERVLGKAFFREVARCMDNSLVARRFDDAAAHGESLDISFDYVLAFRSQLTPVKLRLLSDPGSPTRYVLIYRQL